MIEPNKQKVEILMHTGPARYIDGDVTLCQLLIDGKHEMTGSVTPTAVYTIAKAMGERGVNGATIIYGERYDEQSGQRVAAPNPEHLRDIDVGLGHILKKTYRIDATIEKRDSNLPRE